MEGVVNKGMIGQGAFGCVYLLENPKGEEFAVKVMEWLRADPTEKIVVANELRVLKELSHDHVLGYVDHFLDSGLVYIITEYCSGGDLSAFIDFTKRPVPEDLLLVWLWQMACGLEYMHGHENGPVLHRDLKPSNVFLTDTGNVRLGDMGIARILEAPGAMADTFCGTPPYMSPEALFEKPYNAKTDMWSLGCCVVEMVTLQKAYQGSNIFILRDAVRQSRQPLPSEYSGELDELLSKLLRVNFERRISAKEVLDDPIHDLEHAEPMELLKRHNLMAALLPHNRVSASSPTRSAMSAKAIPTLRDSMANLARILDEGEPIVDFRVKIDNRMRGRRQDDDTVTNSSAMKTVIYKPHQTVKAKTTKKTLKLPTKPAPAAASQEPDDALSRPVLSAMNATVLNLMDKAEGESGTVRKRDTASGAGASGDVSRLGQMSTLRAGLARAIGESALVEASAVVDSARSQQELTSQLSPLMGEYQSTLSNILIYLFLMESTTQQSTTDA